jgi:hypothetical protein
MHSLSHFLLVYLSLYSFPDCLILVPTSALSRMDIVAVGSIPAMTHKSNSYWATRSWMRNVLTHDVFMPKVFSVSVEFYAANGQG